MEGDRLKKTLAPLFFVASLFVAGVLKHQVFSGLRFWIWIEGVLLLAAMLLARHRYGGVVIAAAVAGAGLIAGELDHFYFARDEIGLFTSDEPRLATVEVRVEEAPRALAGNRGRQAEPEVMFDGTAVRVVTRAGWERASGKVRVTVAQQVAAKEGDVVRITGMLERPLPAANPGQTDWARMDRLQRLLVEMHVAHASGVRVVAAGGRSWLAPIREGARALLSRGFEHVDVVDGELLQALLFGDRPADLRSVQESFRKTGTAHLFSSSGVRVGILAGCVYLFCACLCVSPRKSVWIALGFVALFALVTMPTAQAVRPMLLAGGVAAASLFRRRVDPVQLLSLAALLLLSIHPLDLYSAGFQLSFAIVLGLMLLTPTAQRWMDELRDPDVVAAGNLVEMTWGLRVRRVLFYAVRDVGVPAWIAWVVAAPLVAYHFQQFNILSAPLGIALSPLVFVSILGGFLKVALTGIFPWAATYWATIGAAPVLAVRASVQTLSHVPGVDLPIASPPIWLIAGCYLLIFWPIMAPGSWREAYDRLLARLKAPSGPGRCASRIAPGVLGVSVLLVLGAGAADRAVSGDLRVTLLSVGAGQCAAVELPNGEVDFIDCGSSTLSDPLRECIEPFLRHESRRAVHAIYLSHGDYDHICAAEQLARDWGAQRVYIGPEFRLLSANNATATSLLAYLDRSGRPPVVISAGQKMGLGGGATLDVLWPAPDPTLNSNNSGLVLRLNYAGKAILFPADIQTLAEQQLLKTPLSLRADVVVAPHHGSAEESSSAFLAAVGAQEVVSSNAARLSRKQRTFDSLPTAHPLFRTSRCGAIEITIRKNGALSVRGFVRTEQEGSGPAR